MRRSALLLIGCMMAASASATETLKPTDTISLGHAAPAASTTTTDFHCDSGLRGSVTHVFERTPNGFASRLVSVRIGASELVPEQLAEANSAIGSAVITQAGAECGVSKAFVIVTTWSPQGGTNDAVRISFVDGAIEIM